MDCLAIQPSNIKAYYRIAKAANIIAKYKIAVEYCEKGFAFDANNKELQKEMQYAKAKILEEEERKSMLRIQDLNFLNTLQKRKSANDLKNRKNHSS